MHLPSHVFQKARHRTATEVYGDSWSLLRDTVLRVAMSAFRHPSPRQPQLDLDETPDTLKRDLGFLDGHAPYREEDFLR
ncbi:MAG: hypothetical protein KGI75_20275 [Rhizobiaceae bacterium]|nr:hypothetical protein [Rhizobiaceae bacterium]